MPIQRHTHDGVNSPKIDFNNLNRVSDTKVTYNPSELSSGSAETADFIVKPARLSDFVLVSAPYDLQGITATGYVSGKGTVTVQLVNLSGSTVNLISGTAWILKVIGV